MEKQDLLAVRPGQRNAPRDVALYLCRVLRNDTLMDLGKSFGMTWYSPAGSAVERIKKRLTKDKILQGWIEQIKDSFTGTIKY